MVSKEYTQQFVFNITTTLGGTSLFHLEFIEVSKDQ